MLVLLKGDSGSEVSTVLKDVKERFYNELGNVLVKNNSSDKIHEDWIAENETNNN